MPNAIYRHNKTGNLYIRMGNAISADYATKGQSVVIYTSNHDGVTYTRLEREFDKKFTEVEDRRKSLRALGKIT